MGQTVIDFHTHPYLSEEEFLNFYPECFTPTPEQCRRELERAGISKICGSVILKAGYRWEEGFAPIRQCNDRALKLRDLLGGFYLPGFHIHPDFVEESIEEIQRMHAQGIRLIGELVPYLHGWSDYANRNLSKILDAAGAHHMTVSFHTMANEQDEMTRMVREHPDVTFVAAHPGEKEVYLKHLERMEQCDNLYLDLSGTGIFRYGLVAYGVNRIGSERLLFGTDYPICNPRIYVQAIHQEPISEAERENIMHKNAERLLGLNEVRADS